MGKSNDFTYPQNFINLSKDLHKSYYKPEPESIIDDQIVVIPNFFSKNLCQELITSFEKSIHLETTPLIKLKNYALRQNDRYSSIDYSASTALWNYLKEFILEKGDEYDFDTKALKTNFASSIGLNPNLRVYRYKPGHHFGKHFDEAVDCTLDGKIKGITGWTLLIYLTGGDEFTGGGTIFYDKKPTNIHPTKGMALLHKHGDDCLLHEGELVKKGVKWVIRSDVVFPSKR